MTAPMNDDKLLALLGDSLADNQPPSDAIDAAYAAFGWRTLEADLAHLIEDSQVEVVGFREAAFGRVMAYETERGSLEVSLDNDRFQITVAPRPTTVVLRQPLVSRGLMVDETGKALGSGIAGSVRFEITWPDGSAAITPWLTL